MQEAIDLDVPAPVITLSLLTRFRSRQDDSFGAKVIAALRNEFGGHAVKTHVTRRDLRASGTARDVGARDDPDPMRRRRRPATAPTRARW